MITHHSAQVLMLLISSLNPAPESEEPLIASSIPLSTRIEAVRVSVVTVFG